MVLLLQGQSDPLMPGQRKANLKCQSPMDTSEVRARCIYEAIGWFRIGSCNVTCSEEEALGSLRAIVLLEFVSASRTSTVSACPSLASISTLGVVSSHVVLDSLHWGCLQLRPGNRI